MEGIGGISEKEREIIKGEMEIPTASAVLERGRLLEMVIQLTPKPMTALCEWNGLNWARVGNASAHIGIDFARLEAVVPPGTPGAPGHPGLAIVVMYHEILHFRHALP